MVGSLAVRSAPPFVIKELLREMCCTQLRTLPHEEGEYRKIVREFAESI